MKAMTETQNLALSIVEAVAEPLLVLDSTMKSLDLRAMLEHVLPDDKPFQDLENRAELSRYRIQSAFAQWSAARRIPVDPSGY